LSLSPDPPPEPRAGAADAPITPRSAETLSWSRMALLALAYFALALLFLRLDLASGYAVPLWPAAGLALGGLLLCGWRCWPAVWLGSFAATLLNQMLFLAAATSLPLLASTALIASGAALQALLGAYLVRPFLKPAAPLAQLSEAAAFLALGGPLACLVSASFGVAGLTLLQHLPAEALAANWFAWWAGDSLGVLLFAPLVLLVLPGSRQAWRGRALRIGTPLLIAGILVMAGYIVLNRVEQNDWRTEMASSATDIKERLRAKLDKVEGRLHGIHGLVNASMEVTPVEFAEFGRSVPLLTGLTLIEWLPRVPQSSRAQWEEAARRAGWQAANKKC